MQLLFKRPAVESPQMLYCTITNEPRYTQANEGIATDYTETQRKIQCFCALCGNCSIKLPSVQVSRHGGKERCYKNLLPGSKNFYCKIWVQMQAALLRLIIEGIHRAKGNVCRWAGKVQINHRGIYMCMAQQFFYGKYVYPLL